MVSRVSRSEIQDENRAYGLGQFRLSIAVRTASDSRIGYCYYTKEEVVSILAELAC